MKPWFEWAGVHRAVYEHLCETGHLEEPVEKFRGNILCGTCRKILAQIPAGVDRNPASR